MIFLDVKFLRDFPTLFRTRYTKNIKVIIAILEISHQAYLQYRSLGKRIDVPASIHAREKNHR